MRSRKYLSPVLGGILLWCCCGCFDRPLSGDSLAQSNDDPAIRALTERFLELYQQKDLDRLIALWSKNSPSLVRNRSLLLREFGIQEKILVQRSEIRQLRIEGTQATLRLVVEVKLTRAHAVKDLDKNERKSLTIEAVNEDGTWKLWKCLPVQEELAAVIIAAKTDEERQALINKEPELINSDLVAGLLGQAFSPPGGAANPQLTLAITNLGYQLSEQVGDPLRKAFALMNTGYIHGWIGTPDKSPELALEYYQRGLEVGEEYGFTEVTSKALVSSGQLYQTLGELALAAKYYERGLKAADEFGDRYLRLRALNNLATIDCSRGNYARGLELSLRALQLAQSRLQNGQDWMTLAYSQANIARIFSFQGNDEQALVYYQMAQEATEKAISLGNPYGQGDKAKLLTLMGAIYLQQGNHSLAMEHYQKGLELMEKYGITVGNNKENAICEIKVCIGDVLVAENKPSAAVASYQEALKIAEQLGAKSIMANPLLSLAAISLKQKEYREALAFVGRAIEAAEGDGLRDIARDGLILAAQAHRKLGQPEEARQALARAIGLAEQIRGQLAGGEVDRQRSFEAAVAPYKAMIDLQIDQQRNPEAFAYAQQSKGRTLLELLQNGRVDIDQSASPAEREQEQGLNRQIVSLNRSIADLKLKPQSVQARLPELEARLKKIRLEFEAFQTTLYAAHPELKVHRGEIRPISIDDAAGLCPDSRTALLDFVVTNEQVQLFVLTRETPATPITLTTHTVKIERNALAEKVERFRRRLANRDVDFQRLAQELYSLLLKPAQLQLHNKTALIISPDSILWDLPFQSLQSAAGRYLIEDVAISYAPSLSVLREMRSVRQKQDSAAGTSLLAVGNPELGKQTTELIKFALMGEELRPLPEAAKQVETLGKLYGRGRTRVYIGAAAREEVVKQESAQYRILHLATHGIINDASPMYSHVLLAQTPGKNEEDGLLEAWEIMNLKLNADLVVLSACETARGRVSAGEGVIGLTWALFVAGCPTTVVSQWKVESASTSALMVEFHKRFKTRFDTPKSAVSTAEALRQAALKLMRTPQYRHPFFWGGFVVVGDGN